MDRGRPWMSSGPVRKTTDRGTRMGWMPEIGGHYRLP